MKSFLQILSIFLIAFSSLAEEEKSSLQEKQENIFGADFSDQPTYIKSNSLTLRANERIFLYEGNVEVRQGDMTLYADQMEGTYAENNEIEQLVAKQNVLITKGETIRATSELATYLSRNETLTLTENPELQQDGSVLTADAIVIYLAEDRSVAQGEVRVKLARTPEAAGGKKDKEGVLKLR